HPRPLSPEAGARGARTLAPLAPLWRATDVQRSDHFDGRRFFNPESARRTRLWHMLRWLATRRKQRWPRWVEDEPAPGPPEAVGAGELALTFVNHSTFLLQTGGLN